MGFTPCAAQELKKQRSKQVRVATVPLRPSLSLQREVRARTVTLASPSPRTPRTLEGLATEVPRLCAYVSGAWPWQSLALRPSTWTYAAPGSPATPQPRTPRTPISSTRHSL